MAAQAVQTVSLDLESKEPPLMFAGRAFKRRGKEGREAQIFDFVIYYSGGKSRPLWSADEPPPQPLVFSCIGTPYGPESWRPDCIEPHSQLPEMGFAPKVLFPGHFWNNGETFGTVYLELCRDPQFVPGLNEDADVMA